MKKRLLSIVLVLSLLLSMSTVAFATETEVESTGKTITVEYDANKSAAENGNTLRSTVVAANDGDTVIVPEGEYSVVSQIDIKGKSLTVIGEDGAHVIATDTGSQRKAFYITGYDVPGEEDMNVVIKNILITETYPQKATIWVRGHANVTFENITCESVFVDNNYGKDSGYYGKDGYTVDNADDDNTVNLTLNGCTINKLSVEADSRLGNKTNVITDENCKVSIRTTAHAGGLGNITINGETPTFAGWQQKYVYTVADLTSVASEGGNAVLMDDVVLAANVNIPAEKSVELDLNGYTLTGPDDGKANWYAFIVEGNLTLDDNSEAQTGNIYAKCYGIETKNAGVFTMNGGKIVATNNKTLGTAIVNYGGTVVVNDGDIETSVWAVNTQGYFGDKEAVVEINGGKFTLEGATDEEAVLIKVGGEYNNNGAKVTVAGGTYVGTALKAEGEKATLTVTGGTFTDDPTAYLPEGYEAIKTEAGFVVKQTVLTPDVDEDEKTAIESGIQQEIDKLGDVIDDETAGTLVEDLVTTMTETEIKEETGTLADAMQDKVEEIQTANPSAEVKAEIKVEIAEVKITAESDLPITATASKVLVLEIAPVVTVDGEVEAYVDTNKPVTITIPIPEAFAKDGDELTVIHTKQNGDKFYYTETVEDGKLTFVNPNGFSTFEIVATLNTLEGIINNYEEVYKRVYAYADAEGYIDYVADVLGQVADAIDSVDVDALDIPAEFKDELNAAAPIVVADIRELQADLAADEYATFAELVANGGDLVSDVYDDLLDLYDIAQSAGSDAYDLAVEIYETEKPRVEAAIEDIKDQIRAEIEKIEGEIEEDIEDAKEDLENKIDEIVEIDVDLSEIKAIIAELEGIAGGINAQIAALAVYTDGTSFDADIVALEAAVAAVEAYAGRLNAFVVAIEELADDVDAPKLSIEYVESVVAQAQAIAAEAEALVADAQASVTVLVEVYEAVAPVLTELLAVVEEGSPVDGVIDTVEETVGAFADTAAASYEAVLDQLNASAAVLEPVISTAVEAVCGAVAEALETITTATETAAQDIVGAVEQAVETIKGEAQTFLDSTDDEIREAGEALLDVIETIDLQLADVDYEAAYAVVEPVADEIIAKLQTVTDIESAQTALTESLEVIETLEPLAQDIYDAAEADVFYLLGRAEELGNTVYGILETAGTGIAGAAGTAVENSAEAVITAAETAAKAVETAVKAYEAAVEKAAAEVIIPVVTEAVEAISAEAAAIAGVASNAVEVCIEKAQEAQAILDALDNVVYDATHGEIALNCGESIDGKLIVVDQINVDDFAPYMVEQIMDMVGELLNDEIERNGVEILLTFEDVNTMIAQFGLDLTATYTAPDWTGFDADAITAKNDILTIVENYLVELGVEDVSVVIEELVPEYAALIDDDLAIEIPVVDLLVKVAENVIYKYFTFAVEFPAALDAVRAAADAHVVVVGMENNMAAGLAAALPQAIAGMLDLGAYAEYFDMIVDVLNAHLFAYAAVNANVTYVDDIANLADAIIVTRADCAWGAATYEWAKVNNEWTCTATRVCTNNAAHVETADATVTSVEKIPATTTEMGTTTYTATFDVAWAETQTMDVQDIAKLPGGGGGGIGGGGGYSWHCNGGAHCPSCQFTDLAEVIKTNPRIWWHEYTDYVIKNKLMNGMTDELFMPNYTTTRAMLVTILWREAGSPIVDAVMPFEDVEAGQWYTEAIRWAASKGIVDGMSDTEFAPDAKITREQMVTIFYRYAKNNGVNMNRGNSKTIEKFCDVENISDWAYDAVKWACGIKFVDGKENNNIDPVGNATRVEMATLIMRFIEDVM